MQIAGCSGVLIRDEGQSPVEAGGFYGGIPEEQPDTRSHA